MYISTAVLNEIIRYNACYKGSNNNTCLWKYAIN